MTTTFLLCLGFLYICSKQSEAACGDFTTCDTCISNSDWWVSCRWCPLTKACHSPGYYTDNICSSRQQVTSTNANQCSDAPEQAVGTYNVTVAEQMSKFSSLAYTTLQTRDEKDVREAVHTYIDPSYQVVEYFTSDCGMPLESGDCAVVILISHVDRRVVVTFRGTETNFQLFEEFLGGVTGQLEFDATGGQILSYFLKAHMSLYGCVEGRVGHLLMSYPGYHVYVTGHSLGGAEAQLTAVSLIADGIASRDAVKVYTFGSPRVGDMDFAYGYDKLVGESWRLVNKYDPVPRLVPKYVMFVSYAYHTRTEIYYDTVDINTQTNYTVCTGNEDENCSAQESTCYTETCVYCHMRYFGPAIQNYMRIKIPVSSKKSAVGVKKGSCTSFAYN